MSNRPVASIKRDVDRKYKEIVLEERKMNKADDINAMRHRVVLRRLNREMLELKEELFGEWMPKSGV